MSTRVYFSGLDANGLMQLWTSDGTAANTVEIVSPLASAAGLDPADFVALAGRTLFVGTDNQGDRQFRTTDGTGKGTAPVVVTAASANGLQPDDITPFRNGALFAGADPAGIGLFFSDGTTAGTVELTANDGVQGGPDPADITTLGSGSLAVFAGFDANGSDQLYVTNGTATGTGVITVANSGPFGLVPTNITAFGTGALLFGNDGNSNTGLYVTDGTMTGTSELLAAPSGATDSDLVSIGTKALLRERVCGEVHYIHIELERHDVILAEGAPCETFLDDEGSRSVFHNAAEYVEDGHEIGEFCVPRDASGYAVEIIRRRMSAPLPAKE